MEKKSKQSVKESRYEFVCRQYFKQVNQSADRFCVELSWQWIGELHKLAILYTFVNRNFRENRARSRMDQEKPDSMY